MRLKHVAALVAGGGDTAAEHRGPSVAGLRGAHGQPRAGGGRGLVGTRACPRGAARSATRSAFRVASDGHPRRRADVRRRAASGGHARAARGPGGRRRGSATFFLVGEQVERSGLGSRSGSARRGTSWRSTGTAIATSCGVRPRALAARPRARRRAPRSGRTGRRPALYRPPYGISARRRSRSPGAAAGTACCGRAGARLASPDHTGAHRRQATRDLADRRRDPAARRRPLQRGRARGATRWPRCPAGAGDTRGTTASPAVTPEPRVSRSAASRDRRSIATLGPAQDARVTAAPRSGSAADSVVAQVRRHVTQSTASASGTRRRPASLRSPARRVSGHAPSRPW